jgi:hypothetical protein
MLKVTSQNLFSVSLEDHTEETAKELDEQGAISTADAEEVVAPITPDADTAEAGDDIGQATPKEEIGADDKADITQTVTEDEVPLDGAPDVTATTDDSGQTAEMTELFQEGEQAAATKDEIVQEATAEVTGGDAGDATDVNGNPVTPEQASVNAEEDATEDEIDDEVEEEAAAKDIHQEAAEVDENSDEELGEAINDNTDEAGEAGAEGEGGDLGGDAGGDLGDGGDAAAGTDDLGDLGDDTADDDTPLEGAADLGDSTDTTTDESTTDDVDATGASTGDTDNVDGTDGLGDAESTTEDPLVDTASETGDVATDGTTETALDETGGDTSDVTEEVEQQNEAADVTAEAASSDVDETAFIADETPEQEGNVPETADTTVADDTNDGSEIVAEAEAPATSGDDVSTATSTTEEEDTELDDDTPLEGAEDLGVDAETDLTPAGQDNGEEDATAATVEESTTDQTAEDLQDGLDDVSAATAEVEEDAGEPVDTTTEETADTTGDEVTEETDAVDVEGGEVEATEEEADFDAGEVDIKDVDTSTTDEDVEEAMANAAEVGEWGDADEKEADIGDKTIEELQKEKESLEVFRVLLEDGIANEKYDPGLLAYMNGTMEPLRKKLAALDAHFEDKISGKVSLEMYGPKDMDLAYRATLESFQGMVSRITTVTTGIAHKIEKWWSRGLVDKVVARADALDKQIDLCLTQLKDADYSTKDITGVRGYLSTSETNLVKAVGEDLKLTTDISIKGIKASEGLQGTVVKALNDIISAGNEKEIDRALDGLADLKGTKESFPSAAFTTGLLGGWKLEIREASGTDRTDRIEALGHTGIPVGVKSGKAGDGSTYKLSKGDIANLLKFAKTYVGVARKLANTTGDRAVEISTKVRTTRNRALPVTADTRVRGDEHGVDAAATTMKLLAQAHLDLYKFITKHCVEVADACCMVAKKAIK